MTDMVKRLRAALSELTQVQEELAEDAAAFRRVIRRLEGSMPIAELASIATGESVGAKVPAALAAPEAGESTQDTAEAVKAYLSAGGAPRSAMTEALGVTGPYLGTVLAKLVRHGEVERVGRGMYQLATAGEIRHRGRKRGTGHRLAQAIRFLEANRTATPQMLAKGIGTSRSYIGKILRNLVKMGVAKQDRYGVYSIVEGRKRR